MSKIGDFDVANCNSDGSVVIRWFDPLLRMHFSHTVKDPNTIFQPFLDKVFYARNQIVEAFGKFQTDTIGFLTSEDGYFLSPMENPKILTMPDCNIGLRWRGSPQQRFEYDVDVFVQSYNFYHKTMVETKHVLPLVQKYFNSSSYIF